MIAWIQMKRIEEKLDIDFAIIPSIFWVDQGQPV
jgi:hypothetical protein